MPSCIYESLTNWIIKVLNWSILKRKEKLFTYIHFELLYVQEDSKY